MPQVGLTLTNQQLAMFQRLVAEYRLTPEDLVVKLLADEDQKLHERYGEDGPYRVKCNKPHYQEVVK